MTTAPPPRRDLARLEEDAAALRALAKAATNSEVEAARARISWLMAGKSGPPPGPVDLRCLRVLNAPDEGLCQQERPRRPVPDVHHGVDAYEPACGAHLTPDERAERSAAWVDYEVFDEDGSSRPACWSWPVPRDATGTAVDRLQAFHAGRCAMCGHSGRRRLIDHDHVTLDVRGYLCRSCNVLEGRKHGPVQVAYRLRHPADMLGVSVVYGSPSYAALASVCDPSRVETTPGYERHILTYLHGRQGWAGLEIALRARVGTLRPDFQALLPAEVRHFCGLP